MSCRGNEWRLYLMHREHNLAHAYRYTIFFCKSQAKRQSMLCHKDCLHCMLYSHRIIFLHAESVNVLCGLWARAYTLTFITIQIPPYKFTIPPLVPHSSFTLCCCCCCCGGISMYWLASIKASLFFIFAVQLTFIFSSSPISLFTPFNLLHIVIQDCIWMERYSCIISFVALFIESVISDSMINKVIFKILESQSVACWKSAVQHVILWYVVHSTTHYNTTHIRLNVCAYVRAFGGCVYTYFCLMNKLKKRAHSPRGQIYASEILILSIFPLWYSYLS